MNKIKTLRAFIWLYIATAGSASATDRYHGTYSIKITDNTKHYFSLRSQFKSKPGEYVAIEKRGSRTISMPEIRQPSLLKSEQNKRSYFFGFTILKDVQDKFIGEVRLLKRNPNVSSKSDIVFETEINGVLNKKNEYNFKDASGNILNLVLSFDKLFTQEEILKRLKNKQQKYEIDSARLK